MLCNTINQIFRPEQRGALSASEMLLKVVTDRNQLRQIDYEIALIVAEICSGKKGPRAFRDVSYKQIRRSFGLESICMRRNHYER